MLTKFYPVVGKKILSCIAGLILFNQFLFSQQCWPVFESSPENQTISCGEELPPFHPCSAISDCCDGLEVETFTSETGAVLRTCSLSTAFGSGPDWAVWLPDIYPGSVSWTFDPSGVFTEYADGTAHLYGTLSNISNPDGGFIIDVWFQSGRNWSDWSALGRSYKDDYNLAGNLYQTWTYYELADGFCSLTGTGNLAGNFLEISHYPASYYYGFQTGLAATNKNSNDGISGWILYSGWFNGEWLSGHGDINADRTCIPTEDSCGSTEFTQICRASNNCHYTAYQTQTITVVDTEAPEVTSLDSPLLIPCSEADSIYITAVDNCSEVFITFTDEIIAPGCNGSVTRHYTISDGCGNTTTAVQIIGFTGGIPQFVDFPEDISIDCSAVQNLDPEVTFTAGCANTELSESQTILPGDCPNNYTLLYTFTISDDCGNSVSQVWTVTVSDNSAPVLFNVPADQTIHCGDAIPDALVYAVDNCSPTPEVGVNAETIPLGCGYQFIRTWYSTDECGNTVEASQTITVLDNQAPVFTFVPETVVLQCGDEIDFPGATAEDACSTVEVTFTDIPIDEGCIGSFIRTYTATDGCGNTATASVHINIVDNVPPHFISFPEDITVTCSDIPGNDTVNITYADNCGTVAAEFSEETVPGNCPNTYSVLRTWTISDDCENTVSQTWTISVQDTEAPVLFGVPQDATINCGDPVADALVYAVDNCSPAPEVGVSAETIPLGCGYLFIRTWYSSDECGNTAEASQTITVLDNQAPVFTFVPETVVLQCGGEINFPGATAEDSCSSVEVTFTDTPLDEDCIGSFIRTYTATDGCGNSATAFVQVNVVDNTPPHFTSFPEDITASCSDVPGNETANISYADNCGTVVAEFSEETVPGNCPNAYSVLRTWTISDDCGNSASKTWTISVIDDQAPVIIGVPANTTMSCENTPDDAVVVAVDNCSPSVNVSLSAETIPNQCGYTFIRTWTATDDCGNVATASQVIEAFDAESPVFTFVPEDVVIGCGENIDVTPAIAEDACSSVTIDYFDSMPSDCSGSFTRTFTATDGCGNSSVASQQITIVDSIPPVVVSFPDNITVDCLNIPDIDDVVIEFSDACSEVTVSFTQNIISGECDGEYQILYSYLAEDNCGNHINPVWVINVVDNEAPVFAESPEDTFIECGDELPIANTPAAIDNCTSVSVSLSESVQETECGFITTRTWTATDACGNSSQISQNITSEDTTPPYFIEFPENVTVECNEIPGNESSEVTYSDNCSAVSVQFSETTVSGDCPNGYSILRTWTLTDDCGNSQSMTWTITVQDTEAPTLLGVPQDITINCGDPISDALVFATDNCSDFIEVSLSAQTIQLECGYLFIRTWAGNDDCGNHTEASQTITVLDNQPPVFDFVPESILITCGNQPEINDATASDACSNVTVTYTDTPVEGDCIGSFIRNYTATDGCGNSATASVTVNIMDNVPPQFLTFPQDLTVDCSDVPGVESADVTYIDNCGTVSVEIDEVTIPGECPNSYTLQRTWTLTDDCGNSSYGTWTIQVEDHIAPVLFGVPEDTSLFCGESPSDAIVFAVDNCSTGLIVSLTGQTVENDCGFTFLRTWSTTDECGNVGSLSQTIGVIDLIPPVFNFVPSDTIIFCDAAIDITQATATDLCSDVTVTFSDILTGDCAGSFIRTYTATDACGNNASVNQNVTINDNTAPSFIGVPNDLIIECGDELPAPVTPEVTDNCSEVSVSLSESTQDTECGFITVRTWTATDACGNSSQISQSIISADTTPPFFLNFPNDIAAECDNIPGNESTDVTFGDNCGDVSVQFSETTISGNCPNSYQILRTWILTDDCGNSQSGTWTISVQDTEAPVLIGVPQDVTINCGDPITDALVFATDNCSPFVEVSLSAQTIQQECGYLFIRTWTGTDDCGNSAQSSQTITVIDNQPPVFTFVPETVSVTCGNEFGVADATAIDACSNVTVTFADTPLESGCLGSFLRTFTATDGCGNSATASVIVNFIDNTPPQFLSFPSDVNVDCSEVPDAESSGVTYTDNCSSVFVQISETTIPGNCPNSYTLLRTWTLTDECGNTASATWTIQSQDVTDPVLFNVPADTTINCSDVPAEVVVTATDNCSVELEVSYTSVETDHTECGYTIERTWRAEDECGNSEMAIQLVHVIDDAPPVFTFVPSDVVINCGDAILSQPAMATDECSSVSISFEDQFLDDCAGSFVRVFTATDACGNSTTAQQNVTLFDFTPPTIINFPPDITVNCQNVPSIEDGGAQFTDNCSELSITVSESTVPGECSSEYTVIYSYHVEDACGNGIDPVWTIHVTDTDAPVFNEVPAPILGECGSENSVIPPVATDLCSEVTVTYTDTETELDCGLQIVRVWTATDACGNSTSVNQTITLEDTTGPEFTTFPEDLYYSCSDGEPPLVLPSALDACAGEVPVYYTDLISAGECPGETVIQRVFRAFDDCGNDVLNVQMIYIEDTEGPVFDENTSYISVSCNDYSGILTSATDACSDFSIEYSDEVFEGGCGGSVQRTYIATDLCGNQTVFEQFIELTDDTSPQFDAFPAEVTAECSNIPPSNTSLIQYSDNCSSVELTVSEEIIDGSCINTYTLLRTYTLTDACGNETSQVWTINVSDTTPPVLFGVPADATVDCGDVIPDALVFAQDNCSGSTAVGLSASTEETDCGYIFTRIWTSTDDCGNTSQATQIITAIDQSAPVLEGTPEDLVLECGSVLPEVASVTATDNCAGVLNVDYVETPVGDNCGSVQRTWCATDCAEQVTCYTQNITFVTMLNPSLDIFYQNANEVAIKLTVDNNMPSLLDLYSISGKEIQRLLNTSLKKGEYYSYSIPTSELAAGVYVVRLYTGGKTLTQRFVVSR